MIEDSVLMLILIVCLVALGLYDVWFFGRDRGKTKKKTKEKKK